MKPVIYLFYKRIGFSFIILINVISSVYGQKEPTVTFSVLVYDEAHNPIKDVTVTIDQTRQQPNRKTDSSGLIEFTHIKPGQIVIRANKEGYFSGETTTNAMPSGYPENNRAEVILEKKPHFTIQAYNDNKLFKERVYFKIKQIGAPFDSTDDSGFKKLENQLPGSIDVLIFKEGFDVVDSTFNITRDNSLNNFYAKLKRTKNPKLIVYGDLRDAKKNYVLNADINIRVLPFDTTIKSDSFGNFHSSFDYKQITSNQIEVKVNHAEYQKTDKIVRTIQPGQLLYKIHERDAIILKKKLI